MKDEAPSQEFMDACTSGSSIRALCEFCGRTCFEDSSNAGSWEQGELEELRDMAQRLPDKYVAMAHVRTGEFDGKSIVTNCPCNELRHYEVWVWRHRQIVAEYVARRAKLAAEKAYLDEMTAETLNEDVSRAEGVKREFAKCSKCEGYFDKEVLVEVHGKLRCPKCSEQDACVDCNELFDTGALDVNMRCSDCAWQHERQERARNRTADEDDNLPF